MKFKYRGNSKIVGKGTVVELIRHTRGGKCCIVSTPDGTKAEVMFSQLYTYNPKDNALRGFHQAKGVKLVKDYGNDHSNLYIGSVVEIVGLDNDSVFVIDPDFVKNYEFYDDLEDSSADYASLNDIGGMITDAWEEDGIQMVNVVFAGSYAQVPLDNVRRYHGDIVEV